MSDIHIETENSILGAILIENNLMSEAVALGITTDMFSLERNKLIWNTFKQLFIKNIVIDPNMVSVELKGQINRMGGISYVSQLASCVPTLIGFKDWVKAFKEQYQSRKIKELGYYIQRQEEKTPDDMIADIQQKTLDILKIGANDLKDKEIRYMEHVEQKFKMKFGETNPIYKSGFKYLDERLGGFKKGNYITVVSGSGVGKTTFSLNMALKMAKNGYKTVYYTVEMTESEMIDKITASELEIDFKKISNAVLGDDEMKKLEACTNNLLKLPLDIVEDVISTEDLLSDIMYRVLKNNVEVVFVDYLQLFCESSKGNTLSEKLGDLTISLKKLAQRNKIVIFALAQTNRAANLKMREDDPQSFLLSEQDIQDSSRIFQNSNIVLGIVRNTFLDDEDKRKVLADNNLLNYNTIDITENPELMIVQCMKNRSGSIGKVGLRYIGNFSKVDNFNKS